MTPKETTNSKLDYDPLAAQYNQRYHANPLSGVEQALIQLRHARRAERILEVGCGTGRWLEGLDTATENLTLLGLDSSFGMLEQAQTRPTSLSLVQGKAGRLPFKNETFDLIICVNAIHHFDDPARFVFQARQILRPEGVLVIIGQVPHDRRNHWFVYDYFEATYEKDLQRFPTWGTITDWMIAAGFQQLQWEPVEWISDDKIGWPVLDDPFLQKQATSQLALLSDAAYSTGIEKLKVALQQAEARAETLVFKSQLRLDMLIGTTPKEA